MEKKIETILLDWVADLNPVNFKTGARYKPTQEKFESDLFLRVQDLVNLFEAQCKECPMFDHGEEPESENRYEKN